MSIITCLLVFIHFSLLFPSLAIGYGSHRNRVCEKKRKLYWEQVIFSINFSLSFSYSLILLLWLAVSRSLPRLLKVKQCVERSISLINTTQQHSALRGEMKRHGGMSTCWPGVVLTNDTYHTSHGWEQERGRRDRVGMERQTRERWITVEWECAF